MFKHVSNPTKIQTFCNVVAAKGIWGLSEIEDGLWRKMFLFDVMQCCGQMLFRLSHSKNGAVILVQKML